MNTVGYKELFLHLEGKIGLGDRIAEMKKNTRQYAKRQITWFKKDQEYQWLPPDPDAIIKILNGKIFKSDHN